MRWFVEVASSGQTEASEKWVVDAAQWQPALQAARSLRGDVAEMTGFSIELLEDGYRAVDPATFVRYIVRRAPDETPISNPRSKAPPGGAPDRALTQPSHHAEGDRALTSSPGHERNGATIDGTSSRPTPTGKASRIAAMLDLGSGAPGSKSNSGGSQPPPRPDTQSRPPRPSQAPPRSWSQGPRPSMGSSPPGSFASTAPRAAMKSTPSISPSSPPFAAVPRPASQPSADGAAAAAALLPAPVVAPAGDALPPAELLFQREEDPSPGSPLTYRESVWVVPTGTSSDAAIRLLTGMFEGVRASLAGAKAGKLVNMAIFDHRFQGKPQGAPLATLTWKDWKDQGQGPEIRRPGEPPASLLPPPAVLDALAAAAAQPSPPVQLPVPAIHAQPAFPPASVDAIAAAPPAAEPVTASRVEVAPLAPPPPASAPREVTVPRSPTPSAPRVRLAGVELITDLFEAMHNLHFLRDSLEGADFVLALVMEKLPSMVGLVHFYDINAREFVVVRAVGPGGAKALQIRTNEKDSLIAEAMRSRRAVVIDDATEDVRAQRGRWALIGSCRSLVCAPVEQGGRFLGLLELSNPRDGGPFQETDGHALTYIGEQFAEFLATRGVVLDPDRISSR